MLLGAFPVEFSIEIVLQESLDNCLLVSNPLVGGFLCNTVSKLPVQTVLNASKGFSRSSSCEAHEPSQNFLSSHFYRSEHGTALPLALRPLSLILRCRLQGAKPCSSKTPRRPPALARRCGAPRGCASCHESSCLDF